MISLIYIKAYRKYSFKYLQLKNLSNKLENKCLPFENTDFDILIDHLDWINDFLIRNSYLLECGRFKNQYLNATLNYYCNVYNKK